MEGGCAHPCAHPTRSRAPYKERLAAIRQEEAAAKIELMSKPDRKSRGRPQQVGARGTATRACRELGIEPRPTTFTGSWEAALEYVKDANQYRRHLTESQLGMVAAKIANLPRGKPSGAVKGAQAPFTLQVHYMSAITTTLAITALLLSRPYNAHPMRLFRGHP
jgi:hypothetical protein